MQCINFVLTTLYISQDQIDRICADFPTISVQYFVTKENGSHPDVACEFCDIGKLISLSHASSGIIRQNLVFICFPRSQD